jgi:hypothetical protein
MELRQDLSVGMLAVESHATVSNVLVMCALGVIGFAAGFGAVFAADLATALVQVLG